MKDDPSRMLAEELRAEIRALHDRLRGLEARPVESPKGAFPGASRRSSRGVIASLIALLGLLAAGGHLYGQGAFDALFIDSTGNVGIGTTAPKATLDVAGRLNVSNGATLSSTAIQGSLTTSGSVGVGTSNPTAGLEVMGDSRFNGSVGINRGAEKNQHLVVTPSDGNIAFNVTDPANSASWLSVLPSGSVIMNGGNVGIGTTTPEAKLEVNGNARVRGQVSSWGRYQRDDQAEGTVDLLPRYHLSLTAPVYGGRTRTIPQSVVEDLCGDPDGCEFRLAMTRWSSDRDTESASRSGLFYYSKVDGHWRASSGESDASGVDGDGKTQHVRGIWGTCFFTDGTYSQYRDLGDKEKGMQLLIWNGYTHPNRTCELTIID